MGRPNWVVAWVKRQPGVPLLGRARVAMPGRVINQPDRLRYSDFEMGATTTVVQFPGDPDMVGRVPAHTFPMPPARKRVKGADLLVPSPLTPNTVSNARRDQLAGLDAVPEGKLAIFEGIV